MYISINRDIMDKQYNHKASSIRDNHSIHVRHFSDIVCSSLTLLLFFNLRSTYFKPFSRRKEIQIGV